MTVQLLASDSFLRIDATDTELRLTVSNSPSSRCFIRADARFANLPLGYLVWISTTQKVDYAEVKLDRSLLGSNPTFFRLECLDDSPAPVTNFVWIPPGTFMMGSPTNEIGRDADEGPRTETTLTRGFWMGQFEVTQQEYLEVMGENPSYFTSSSGFTTNNFQRPVDSVNWYEATNYCERLTQKFRSSGQIRSDQEFRLPTEAEWEYACRAGTTTAFNFGHALRLSMGNYDWGWEYDSRIGFEEHILDPGRFPPGQPPYSNLTSPVGSYPANALGLHEMHGNVWEWCLDWPFGSYSGGHSFDPKGASEGNVKILRGGGWDALPWHCRSANRSGRNPANKAPEYHSQSQGFRVVLTP